jgi:hypothetical protein
MVNEYEDMKDHEISVFFKDKHDLLSSLHLISKELDLDSDLIYLPRAPSKVLLLVESLCVFSVMNSFE